MGLGLDGVLGLGVSVFSFFRRLSLSGSTIPRRRRYFSMFAHEEEVSRNTPISSLAPKQSLSIRSSSRRSRPCRPSSHRHLTEAHKIKSSLQLPLYFTPHFLPFSIYTSRYHNTGLRLARACIGRKYFLLVATVDYSRMGCSVLDCVVGWIRGPARSMCKKENSRGGSGSGSGEVVKNQPCATTRQNAFNKKESFSCMSLLRRMHLPVVVLEYEI